MSKQTTYNKTITELVYNDETQQYDTITKVMSVTQYDY
jgi:hypothetical protein